MKKEKSSTRRIWIWIGVPVITLILLIVVFQSIGLQGLPVSLRQPAAKVLTSIEDAFFEKAHPTFDAELGWSSKGVLIEEMNTGEQIYAQGLDMPYIPASTAKLFTAVIALRTLDETDSIAVDASVLALSPADASSAHLTPGNYELKTLLQGLLIPSGSDAAYALAVAIGRSISENEQLSADDALQSYQDHLQLFLMEESYTDTALVDPTGFSKENKTSLTDMLKISKEALQVPLLTEIVKTQSLSITLPDNTPVTWVNTNPLLDPSHYYYSPRYTGVKTGWLEETSNIILRYENDDNDYLILLFGAPSEQERNWDYAILADRFRQAKGVGWLDRIAEGISTLNPFGSDR